MANTLRFTKYFEKKLAKIIKQNQVLKKPIRSALYLLETNEYDHRLKTHKVTGRIVGECYASRVNGDLRILWKKTESGSTVINILDLGGHSGTGKVCK